MNCRDHCLRKHGNFQVNAAHLSTRARATSESPKLCPLVDTSTGSTTKQLTLCSTIRSATASTTCRQPSCAHNTRQTFHALVHAHSHSHPRSHPHFHGLWSCQVLISIRVRNENHNEDEGDAEILLHSSMLPHKISRLENFSDIPPVSTIFQLF